ncbi:MAG: 50S ribosomal protein L6 [bacterium]|nr:50S ribosomal protein L6 [bacterium]
MSRIGKQPINISQGTEVFIDGSLVRIKGPKGELSISIPRQATVEKDDSAITVKVKNKEDKKQRAIWGLVRALLANMVKGVNEGFEKQLEFSGVGFRAGLKGQDLELSLGFSHPVLIKAPAGVVFKVEKNTITVSGIDKQLVGHAAAFIRSKKPVEPYKGKGIKYIGEYVKRKAGKKAVASA